MEKTKTETSNAHSHYSMSSVHRVVQVLRAFRGSKKLSLTEIHQKTGIGISSLQKMLWTLVYEGFLYKDEETKLYSLGLELMFLGKMVEQNDAFLSIAIPVAVRLNEETNENISISIIEGDQRNCIYNLPSRHELSALTYTGHTSPLYAGASAKVLLAFQSDTFIEQYLKEVELQSITNETITSIENLRENLEEIREKGFGVSFSERVKGAMSISAPIIGDNDVAFAGITVIIPIARKEDYNIDLLVEKVVSAAREISQQLRR